jgi:low affinity Fe/Cu permease
MKVELKFKSKDIEHKINETIVSTVGRRTSQITLEMLKGTATRGALYLSSDVSDEIQAIVC